MSRYIMKRLLSALAVLFFVSLITFLALEAIPGSRAELMLGTDATEEKIEMLEEAMGLNDPWYERYFSWLGGLLRFDLGESALYGEKVSTLIMQRLPVTFSLTVFSLLISVLFSSVLGILAALKKGSLIDGFARSFVQLASAVPSFWLGMVAIIIFAGNLGWFPVNGYMDPSEGFGIFDNTSFHHPCNR